MPSCPNCGRQTMRTKDWACQWCGYPLISRAYKPLAKTFKELQEERNLSARFTGATEPEDRYEPEPEHETPPPPPRPMPRPVERPAPQPVYQRPVEPPPQSIITPPPQTVRPQPVAPSLPPPADVPEQKPAVIPPAPPIILPPAGESPAAPPAQSVEEPRPKPEIIIEPEPPPEPPMKLDAIRDNMEINADQVDTLFRVEKSGAHTALSGKTVVLKGRVEKVFIKDHIDVRYITVTGSRKMTWGIRCSFNRDESVRAARLSEGQDVAVKGRYDGYSKNIMFKDCVVI